MENKDLHVAIVLSPICGPIYLNVGPAYIWYCTVLLHCWGSRICHRIYSYGSCRYLYWGSQKIWSLEFHVAPNLCYISILIIEEVNEKEGICLHHPFPLMFLATPGNVSINLLHLLTWRLFPSDTCHAGDFLQVAPSPNRYTRLENLAWYHSVFWEFIFCRKRRFMKPLLLLSVDTFCSFT